MNWREQLKILVDTSVINTSKDIEDYIERLFEKLIFDASQAALKSYDPDTETFKWKEMEQQLRAKWLGEK